MKLLHSVFISNNAKLWTNIVYTVATYKIIVTPLEKVGAEIFLFWMAIVGGVELLKRVIAGKLGVVSEEPEPGTTIVSQSQSTTTNTRTVAAEAATDVDVTTLTKAKKKR